MFSCLGLALLLSMSITCGGGSSSGDSTPGGSSGGTTPSSSSTIPQFAHVMILLEENHSFADVVGNSSMPYFNGLIANYALATQYFADAHPSLPNYFMLTVGATITSDDNFPGPVTQDNVARALKTAGKTWKCYAESLPSSGYVDGDTGPYLKHHDPFAYLSDVLNDPAEAGNIVPFSQFAADLSSGGLPNYAFIIPNVNHDAHDCPTGLSSCTDQQKLAAADQWLQANIDPLLKSSSFQDSLLIITFDEGDVADTTHGGGQVATLIVSPKSKAGYKSTSLYQHESTLRLSMQALGVADLPGSASAAPDMSEFFQ